MRISQVADVNAFLTQVFLSLLTTCLFHIGYILSTDGKEVFLSALFDLGGFHCAIKRIFWRESSLLSFCFDKNIES